MCVHIYIYLEREISCKVCTVYICDRSHVTHKWVMSHTQCKVCTVYIWDMSHVTHKWVMSHTQCKVCTVYICDIMFTYVQCTYVTSPHTHANTLLPSVPAPDCICVYVYMWICVYVYMCICVYMYMCIYTWAIDCVYMWHNLYMWHNSSYTRHVSMKVRDERGRYPQVNTHRHMRYPVFI